MVERDLAKVEVAGSSPVIRSIFLSIGKKEKPYHSSLPLPGSNPRIRRRRSSPRDLCRNGEGQKVSAEPTPKGFGRADTL